MDPNRYRFSSTWHLDEPPDRVYAVLRDADSYGAWWPQIRGLRRTGEESGELVVRSFLPYRLVLRASGGVEDERARTLRIELSGDLEGYCGWAVEGREGGTVAHFEQEVVVRKAGLRVAAWPARPLLRANHAWMMRQGRRGLVRHLDRG